MFVDTGYLEVVPGKIDEVIAILVRADPELAEVGCLVYEVGRDSEKANLARVVEVWESEEAHLGSLQLPSVQQKIVEARPHLTGNMGGGKFQAVGSPVR